MRESRSWVTGAARRSRGVRSIIKQADPEVVEEGEMERKSRRNSMLGVPVWEHDGIICTGETYKGRREDDLR